jgi:hypothetical protein
MADTLVFPLCSEAAQWGLRWIAGAQIKRMGDPGTGNEPIFATTEKTV